MANTSPAAMWAASSSWATPPVNVTASPTPALVRTAPDQQQPRAGHRAPDLRPHVDQRVLTLAPYQARHAHRHRCLTEAVPPAHGRTVRRGPERVDVDPGRQRFEAGPAAHRGSDATAGVLAEIGEHINCVAYTP